MNSSLMSQNGNVTKNANLRRFLLFLITATKKNCDW